MAPPVNGHNATFAHRQNVRSRESETLLPAWRDRIQYCLLDISLRVREARGRCHQGTDDYADDVQAERQSNGVAP